MMTCMHTECVRCCARTVPRVLSQNGQSGMHAQHLVLNRALVQWLAEALVDVPLCKTPNSVLCVRSPNGLTGTAALAQEESKRGPAR